MKNRRRSGAAGMGTQRGEPVERPPVVLPPCRGCGVAITAETCGYRRGETEMQSGCVCLVCGIDDPVGLLR